MAVLGFILISLGVFGGISLISFVRDFGQSMLDKKNIAATLGKMGFPCQPHGFESYLGFNLDHFNLVVMASTGASEFAQDKEQVLLAQYDLDKDDEYQDEGKLLEYLGDKVLVGDRNNPVFAGFQSITEKGRVDLDGNLIEPGKTAVDPKTPLLRFAQGRLEYPQGTFYNGLVGCLRSGKKQFIVEASLPGDKSLDRSYLLKMLRPVNAGQ